MQNLVRTARSPIHFVFANSRRLSSTRYDPKCMFNNAFYNYCQSAQPGFVVNSEAISILHEPKTFYWSLLRMISRARKRIFISSLYVGAEETELFQYLHAALERNPDLQLMVQVDKLRSTRPGSDSPVAPLINLVNKFPSRARVFLFQPPTLPEVLSRFVPRRFDEGWGTWHAKVYGADDEVILSGANLNRTYFTNRQDRYMHINGHSGLANYCMELLDLFSKFSYRLQGSAHTPNIISFVWENHIERTRMKSEVHRALSSLHEKYKKIPKIQGETIMFPYVQSGSLGILQEEELLGELFSCTNQPESFMNLTTGYFAFYPPYQKQLIESSINCRILVASPLANGFYKSNGLSGLIPDAYTLLEKDFWVRVSKKSRHSSGDRKGISLYEWMRPGWTYHAKGIWLSPSYSEPPCMTIIGSSNLNARSALLDTEFGFALFTRSKSLQKELQYEIDNLMGPSQQVGFHTWSSPSRRVRFRAQLLVRCGVHKML